MDGVRQEKTVNGVTHTYYTDGTKIIAEKVGDKVFEYYYDAQGVIGFKYDGNVYYYKKNLLGDVDRIYDANKNLVAEYKYDAWGNHRIYKSGGIDITDEISYNNSVVKLNPFRYCGYYYDTETDLYYLNSRYYDPSIGRFSNADDISYIQPEQINGLNLYAYCYNNPIAYADESGESIFLTLLIAGLIGASISGFFNVASQLISQQSWDWKSFGLSLLGGFVSGVISALPVGQFAQLGVSGKILSYGMTFAWGGLGAVAGGLITGSVYNGETMATAFLIGGFANIIGRGISEKVTSIKASKIFNQSRKAKSLDVQKLQAHRLNMGSKALKGRYVNAFKNTTKLEICRLLYNASPWLRFGIFSSLTSSGLSGWY